MASGGERKFFFFFNFSCFFLIIEIKYTHNRKFGKHCREVGGKNHPSFENKDNHYNVIPDNWVFFPFGMLTLALGGSVLRSKNESAV